MKTKSEQFGITMRNKRKRILVQIGLIINIFLLLECKVRIFNKIQVGLFKRGEEILFWRVGIILFLS